MVVDDTMPEEDETMSAEQAPVMKEKMTAVKLRSLLEQHKLSTSGNKKTLIERLQVSLCHQQLELSPMG